MKILGLTFGLIGLGLAAASSAWSQDKTKISFIHKFPEPENMAFFDKAVQEYEAANPDIDIVMEAIADEPYKDKIRVLMASNQEPDIYFSWSGEFGRKFARNRRAMDLTDLLADAGWTDRMAKASWEPFQFEGKQYGVPINVNAKYIVYNKSIFEQNNVEPPANFADFLTLLESLKENGVVPIGYGNQSPWAATHYIGDLFAKLVPDDIRVADYQLLAEADKLYTHPGYVEALAFYKELGDKGYFNRGANALSHAVARSSFLAGRTAMMYLELVEFFQIAGTPLEAAGWDFFAIPNIEGQEGRGDLITGAPDGFMISANSKHPKEALEFIDFITSPEQAKSYVKVTGMTSSVIGSVTEDTASQEVLDGLARLEEATGMALWLDTDMDTESATVILNAGQALLNDSETPESVMEKVRETAKDVQSKR